MTFTVPALLNMPPVEASVTAECAVGDVQYAELIVNAAASFRDRLPVMFIEPTERAASDYFTVPASLKRAKNAASASQHCYR